jgi:hypothetical protein
VAIARRGAPAPSHNPFRKNPFRKNPFRKNAFPAEGGTPRKIGHASRRPVKILRS